MDLEYKVKVAKAVISDVIFSANENVFLGKGSSIEKRLLDEYEICLHNGVSNSEFRKHLFCYAYSINKSGSSVGYVGVGVSLLGLGGGIYSIIEKSLEAGLTSAVVFSIGLFGAVNSYKAFKKSLIVNFYLEIAKNSPESIDEALKILKSEKYD